MGNTSKRDRTILLVLLLVFVLLIVYFVSFRPFFEESGELDKKISDARTKISELEGRAAMIAQCKDQLKELEEKIATAEAGKVAESVDVSQYLADFQDITSNATDTSIVFAEKLSSPSGAYCLLRANERFNCSYNELKYVLSRMQNNRVACHDIKLSSAGVIEGSENVVLLTVEYSADYYSRSSIYIPHSYPFLTGSKNLPNLFAGQIG